MSGQITVSLFSRYNIKSDIILHNYSIPHTILLHNHSRYHSTDNMHKALLRLAHTVHICTR